MGIILYIIATLLYIPLTVINFIVVLVMHIKKNGFIDVVGQYFYEEALAIDRFANRSFRTLWNITLIKSDGYEFGKKYETVSSVLGKNQILKKLTITGWILVYILWAIDYKYWFKGGHCVNSITN
jgi:hypothetical protein